MTILEPLERLPGAPLTGCRRNDWNGWNDDPESLLGDFGYHFLARTHMHAQAKGDSGSRFQPFQRARMHCGKSCVSPDLCSLAPKPAPSVVWGRAVLCARPQPRFAPVLGTWRTADLSNLSLTHTQP